jgi:hypothetical protein
VVVDSPTLLTVVELVDLLTSVDRLLLVGQMVETSVITTKITQHMVQVVQVVTSTLSVVQTVSMVLLLLSTTSKGSL